MYSDRLVTRVQEFSARVQNGPVNVDDFDSVRSWTDQLIRELSALMSGLFVLQPFKPFDQAACSALLARIETAVALATDALEAGRVIADVVSGAEMRVAVRAWRSESESDPERLLGDAFGIDIDPVDDLGEFAPSAVFAQYPYQQRALVKQILPHLVSLNVSHVVDALAGVCIIGWITGSADPVAAYQSMHTLLIDLQEASPEVAEAALKHLDERGHSLRQNRARINEIVSSQLADATSEARALAQADVYKRLAEGPVRQYGWAAHRLKCATWSAPPTLTPVRQALVAAGGWYGVVARTSLLTDLRNGEAHETLEWDGYRDAYVVEGTEISRSQVVVAVVVADAFARGCEAALTAFRSQRIHLSPSPPSAGDPGRLPAWRRAEAFFGTNGIRVTRASFNAAIAAIRVTAFVERDINPCFQALTGGHPLLPEVQAFEIRRGSDPVPAMTVSTASLRLCVPVWHKSIATFDRTPLSVFLPANHATRLLFETPSVAARSIAWIAADDLLDALDGSPSIWARADLEVFLKRLALVELALEQCLSVMTTDRVRPEAVLKNTTRFRRHLETTTSVPHVGRLEQAPGVTELRSFYDTWGPVPRMPGITHVQPPAGYFEPQPGLLEIPDDLRYQTL